MAKNNARTFELLKQRLPLKSERVNLLKYPHNCYFWIEFKDKISKECFGQAVLMLVQQMNSFGFPARNAESFGWDFIALSPLLFNHHSGGKFFNSDTCKLRVSVPDFPEAELPFIANIINHWIQRVPYSH